MHDVMREVVEVYRATKTSNRMFRPLLAALVVLVGLLLFWH
jgi:hypothetical protein